MPQTLARKATERSTYPIELTFYDGGESGPAVTPTAATWSLVDLEGAIINGREDVALAIDGSGKGLIVLKGADLAVPGAEEVRRRVLVQATYTSARFGADLPLTEEFEVTVQPLAGIPAGG